LSIGGTWILPTCGQRPLISSTYIFSSSCRANGARESGGRGRDAFRYVRKQSLAEHHIRYGKTGGIAYRHIADNYIALFSRFIACGTYEATYILDALLQKSFRLAPEAGSRGYSRTIGGGVWLGLLTRH